MSEKFEDMKEISEKVYDSRLLIVDDDFQLCFKKSFLTSESVRVFGWFHADKLVRICK